MGASPEVGWFPVAGSLLGIETKNLVDLITAFRLRLDRLANV